MAWYNKIMKNKIWSIKLNTAIESFLGSFVYNFHKRIKGIKTRRNFDYGGKRKCKQMLDVHFPNNADCVFNRPEKRKKKYPTIIYFHGGGWACYSKSLYETLARRMAAMGYVVFCCNYRLAPRAKMKDIEADSLLAFDYVTKVAANFGADENCIVLAGDSAGAHISAELAINLKNSGDTARFDRIKGLALFYGVFDLKTALETDFPNIVDYIDSVTLGGKDNEEELNRYSPLNKDLTGLPPVFMASGAVDKLYKTQSQEFAQMLNESGVQTIVKFFGKKEFRAMHAYMVFDGLATNIETLKCFEDFLREKVCDTNAIDDDYADDFGDAIAEKDANFKGTGDKK